MNHNRIGFFLLLPAMNKKKKKGGGGGREREREKERNGYAAFNLPGSARVDVIIYWRVNGR